MSSKDNINRDEWRNYYDDLAARVDALSTRSSSSEISSTASHSSCHSSRQVVQDRGATQDTDTNTDTNISTNTRILTDVDLLLKEVKALKENNAVMFKSLMALQTDNTQLRRELKTLQESRKTSSTDSGALRAQITALEREVDCLKVEVKTLRSDTETGLQNLKATVDLMETRRETRSDDGRRGRQSSGRKAEIDLCQLMGAHPFFAVQTNCSDRDRGQQKKLHRGVTCDRCNGPVRGLRYKCKVCFDYDLCEDCFASKFHSHHPMLVIS